MPLSEMLNCLHVPENGTDLSVFDKQRPRLKLQQREENDLKEVHFEFSSPVRQNPVVQEVANWSRIRADPGLEYVWPDLGKFPIPRTEFFDFPFNSQEIDYSLSRNSDCSPAEIMMDNGEESVLTEKTALMVGREKQSFKKRKSNKTQNPKAIIAEESKAKKIKKDVAEIESKLTHKNNDREHSNASKENSKVSEAPKQDYIHVRARRGQATDSHSLAERVRREKISERMKCLQELVPGCNKVVGKAGMLDEIINYVQSLQTQVEFLSMKLAALNPRRDFNTDNIFAKEMYGACSDEFPAIEISLEMSDPSLYLQLNSVQQGDSCGLDMEISSSEMALRRTASALSSSNLQNDPQIFYNEEFPRPRSTHIPSHTFTGGLEANDLKMEL